MAGRSIATAPDSVRIREDKAISRAVRIMERRATCGGDVLGDALRAGQLFQLRIGDEKREHLEAAFLDTKQRLLSVERLFSGTIDGAEVHPRIIVQRALLLNAAGVILAHNHPSGDAEPSAADRAMTAYLKKALLLVGVRLLDHFIVTPNSSTSMAARRMC